MDGSLVTTQVIGSVKSYNIFTDKCAVKWCNAQVTPFTFEAGHNIPESKGGETSVDNLRPICGKCNKAMGNRYTIDDYSNTFAGTQEVCNDNDTMVMSNTYAIATLHNGLSNIDNSNNNNNNSNDLKDTAMSTYENNRLQTLQIENVPSASKYLENCKKEEAKTSSSLYIHRGLFNVIACFGKRSNAVKPITA